MKTKIVLSLIIGLIVVVGGSYFLFQNRNAEQVPGSLGDGGDVEVNQEGVFSGSIFDLAKRGGDYKCSVSSQANTGIGTAVSSGVVYVSSNKIKADFKSDISGFGSVNSYMISDGEYVYSWSSMAPQGVKTKVSMTGNSDLGTKTSGQGFDASQNYQYDCQKTKTDSSMFVPPSDVTFISVN